MDFFLPMDYALCLSDLPPPGGMDYERRKGEIRSEETAVIFIEAERIPLVPIDLMLLSLISFFYEPGMTLIHESEAE